MHVSEIVVVSNSQTSCEGVHSSNCFCFWEECFPILD